MTPFKAGHLTQLYALSGSHHHGWEEICKRKEMATGLNNQLAEAKYKILFLFKNVYW
jgi:hypothetical protein